MSYLSAFVNSAKIVGVAVSGFMTGYTIAFSSNVMPGLLKSDLPADKLAIVWNELFRPGMRTSIPCMVLGTLSFGFAAYQTGTKPFNPRLNLLTKYIGLSEGQQLALAAILIAAVAPFTVYYLGPINKRLQNEGALAKTAATALNEKFIKEQVTAWNHWHSFRGVFYATSFILGLLTL
ncbi:hypothetical protein FRC03_003579 [Tulasnella sp. 419]|nr:hypothetical protein FRC02_001406 [Tulasnella sp. 418]KAG8962962.1 hypothetical protein FRC03_003579 [Tulasnella sp. 419]